MEASPGNEEANQLNILSHGHATPGWYKFGKRIKGAAMKLPHLFLCSLMVASIPATALASSPHIIDGDTIVLGGETVRILNIDAPELRRAGCDAEKRLAVLARKRVRELIGDGSSVTLVRGDGKRMKDRHGRTLARVLVNGADIGEVLVADGLARPWEGKRRSWCAE